MSAPDVLPDHVRRNRAAWDQMATEYVENGEVSWGLPRLAEKWGATTTFPYVTHEWASKWPSEEVWKARKRR